MHQHQRDYLVEELRKPEYADAESAYEKLRRPPKLFLAVSFVPQSKFDRMQPKLRGAAIPVSDEYAATFPGGVPGIPNLIRREDFDAAWNAR